MKFSGQPFNILPPNIIFGTNFALTVNAEITGAYLEEKFAIYQFKLKPSFNSQDFIDKLRDQIRQQNISDFLEVSKTLKRNPGPPQSSYYSFKHLS